MTQKTPRGAALRFFKELASAGSYPAECIVWPYARNHAGYAVFSKPRGAVASALVSRVICYEVNGSPETPSMEAAHVCGNGHRACVNPRHLEWKTSKQNKVDQIVHGTRNLGERNGAARLSVDQVRTIRDLARTIPQKHIAKQFGVDPSHISNIVRGKQWRHIQ